MCFSFSCQIRADLSYPAKPPLTVTSVTPCKTLTGIDTRSAVDEYTGGDTRPAEGSGGIRSSVDFPVGDTIQAGTIECPEGDASSSYNGPACGTGSPADCSGDVTSPIRYSRDARSSHDNRSGEDNTSQTECSGEAKSSPDCSGDARLSYDGPGGEERSSHDETGCDTPTESSPGGEARSAVECSGAAGSPEDCSAGSDASEASLSGVYVCSITKVASSST